jgi:hypothetical protein
MITFRGAGTATAFDVEALGPGQRPAALEP